MKNSIHSCQHLDCLFRSYSFQIDFYPTNHTCARDRFRETDGFQWEKPVFYTLRVLLSRKYFGTFETNNQYTKNIQTSLRQLIKRSLEYVQTGAAKQILFRGFHGICKRRTI